MVNFADICPLCFGDLSESHVWENVEEFQNLLKLVLQPELLEQIGIFQGITQICSGCISNIETLKCVHKLSTTSNKKIIQLNKNKITEEDLQRLTNVPNYGRCNYVVCRLCLNASNNVAVYLYDSGRNMFPVKIVTVMLDTIKLSMDLLDNTANPILCWICWQRVQIAYSFLKQLETVIAKVSHYQTLLQKDLLNREDLFDIIHMWDKLGNRHDSPNLSPNKSIQPDDFDVRSSTFDVDEETTNTQNTSSEPSYVLDHDYLDNSSSRSMSVSSSQGLDCDVDGMPSFEEITQADVKENNDKIIESSSEKVLSPKSKASKSGSPKERKSLRIDTQLRLKPILVPNRIAKEKAKENLSLLNATKKTLEKKSSKGKKQKKLESTKQRHLEKKYKKLMKALCLQSRKQVCVKPEESVNDKKQPGIPTLSSLETLKSRHAKLKKPILEFPMTRSVAPPLNPEIDTYGSYAKDLLILQKEEIIKKVRPSKTKMVLPLLSVIPKLNPPPQVPSRPITKSISYEIEVLNFDNEVQTTSRIRQQVDPDEVEAKREVISAYENSAGSLISNVSNTEEPIGIDVEDEPCPNLNAFIKSEPLDYIEIDDDSFEVSEPPELELQGPCNYDPKFTISETYSVRETSASPINIDNDRQPERITDPAKEKTQHVVEVLPETSKDVTPKRRRPNKLKKKPPNVQQLKSPHVSNQVNNTPESSFKTMPLLQNSTYEEIKDHDKFSNVVVRLIPIDLPVKPINKKSKNHKKEKPLQATKTVGKKVNVDDIPLLQRLEEKIMALESFQKKPKKDNKNKKKHVESKTTKMVKRKKSDTEKNIDKITSIKKYGLKQRPKKTNKSPNKNEKSTNIMLVSISPPNNQNGNNSLVEKPNETNQQIMPPSIAINETEEDKLLSVDAKLKIVSVNSPNYNNLVKNPNETNQQLMPLSIATNETEEDKQLSVDPKFKIGSLNIQNYNKSLVENSNETNQQIMPTLIAANETEEVKQLSVHAKHKVGSVNIQNYNNSLVKNPNETNQQIMSPSIASNETEEDKQLSVDPKFKIGSVNIQNYNKSLVKNPNKTNQQIMPPLSPANETEGVKQLNVDAKLKIGSVNIQNYNNSLVANPNESKQQIMPPSIASNETEEHKQLSVDAKIKIGSVFSCRCCLYPTFRCNISHRDDDNAILKIEEHDITVSVERARYLKIWTCLREKHCSRCDFKTTTMSQASNHIRMHMVDLYLHKCSICSFRTLSLESFNTHVSKSGHKISHNVYMCSYCNKPGKCLVQCAMCKKLLHPSCIMYDQARKDEGCFHFNIKSNFLFNGSRMFVWEKHPLVDGPENHCSHCKRYVINWINCKTCRKLFHHHCFFYSNFMKRGGCKNGPHKIVQSFLKKTCTLCHDKRDEELVFCDTCKVFMHEKCLERSGCKHYYAVNGIEDESKRESGTKLSSRLSDDSPRCVCCLSDSPAMGPLLTCSQCNVAKHLICSTSETSGISPAYFCGATAFVCLHSKLNGLIKMILNALTAKTRVKTSGLVTQMASLKCCYCYKIKTNHAVIKCPDCGKTMHKHCFIKDGIITKCFGCTHPRIVPNDTKAFAPCGYCGGPTDEYSRTCMLCKRILHRQCFVVDSIKKSLRCSHIEKTDIQVLKKPTTNPQLVYKSAEDIWRLRNPDTSKLVSTTTETQTSVAQPLPCSSKEVTGESEDYADFLMLI